MTVNIPNDPWTALWSLGYRRLVPIAPPGSPLSERCDINPKDLGKVPGTRNADGTWSGLKGWSTKLPSLSDCERYRDMGCGIGIICGQGLLAIDSDTLSEDCAAAVDEEVAARLGVVPRRVGEAPKALFLVKCPVDYRHPNITHDGGVVEVRTYSQFVAYGTHPKTLRPYTWTQRLVPYDELPAFDAEALDALWAALVRRLPGATLTRAKGAVGPAPDQRRLIGDAETVTQAVKCIPNDYLDRDFYITMLCGVIAACGGDPEIAWPIAWGWCSRWTLGENDEETVRRDFDSLLKGDKRVGASWLYETARTRAPGEFTAATPWDEDVPEGDETPSSDAEPETAATPEVAAPAPPPNRIRPTPYRFPEPSAIPPRQSLYAGHYVRKWVSSTIAPSKVGKSSLVLTEALAMASGKPLLGVLPAGQFRVWWWNGEDPIDELERRVAAAMQYYGLTREDVGDRLLIDSGRDMPINLAVQERSGAKIVERTERELVQAILENRIDVTIFDPFISLHKVSENDNNAIDIVAKKCNDIAGATTSAIELAHHTRKLYGGGATVEDGRGASALLATTRSTRAAAKMTKLEARDYGLGPEYKNLFHFTDASSNIFAPDPDGENKWMKIVSVNLGNGEGDDNMDKIIKGDSVGVVTTFDVKAARRDTLETVGLQEKVTGEAMTREEKALAAVRAQEYRKDSRSDAWVGVPIALALGLDRDSEEGLAQVKAIVKAWLKEGKLVEESRLNKARQVKTFVIAPVRTVAETDSATVQTVAEEPPATVQTVAEEPEDDLFG